MIAPANAPVVLAVIVGLITSTQAQTILPVKDHPTGADDSTRSTSLRGGCEPTPQAHLLPFGDVEPVAFGNSVSTDGDVAVVSASIADAAYVFRFDGAVWSEEQVLLAWDGAPSFGHSVAVSGDAVLVGGTGIKGYVFRFDGSQWIPEQIIEVEQARQEGNGKTEQLSPPSLVALSDNVAVLGSYWSGAHVFRFDGSTWFYQQELVADESYPGDRFGRSVATTGDIVVVGAHYGTGSAYVFRFLDGLWVEEQRLAASDGANLDYFGATLSVSNDVVLVGAELDDDMGFNSGSAYIYRLEGGIWNEEQKLTASDGSAYDLFGWTVSVDGDVVVVGAPYHDGEVSNTGSVYAYRFDGTYWTEQARLLSPDPAHQDDYGFAVSIDGGTALVGVRLDDEVGQNTGSAYVFAGLSDCNVNETFDACDITNGSSSDCNENWNPDECESDADNDEDGVIDICDNCELFNPDQADCQPNGVGDTCDIAEGVSSDCNENGIPDECIALESDCNSNGIPDFCDLNDGTSDDCNVNQSPDECDIAEGISEDCPVFPQHDCCEEHGPGCSDPDIEDCICQVLHFCCEVEWDSFCVDHVEELGCGSCIAGNGVPDECEPDCNDNGDPDECDIFEGISPDANANGIPDECDECLDDNGCGNDQVCVDGVCIIDPACIDDDGDGKVTLCHIPPENPDNARTISVSVNAVPAHLAHGDTCGPCEDDSNLLLMAGEHEACFADMDGDGVVSAADLALLLGNWGPNPGHPANSDDDGVVGAADLAVLLGSWGSCE